MDEQALHELAGRIERAGLSTPATIVLDMLRPFDVISSQLVSFGRPFVGGTGAEPLVKALGEVEAWAELRRLLSRQD